MSSATSPPRHREAVLRLLLAAAVLCAALGWSAVADAAPRQEPTLPGQSSTTTEPGETTTTQETTTTDPDDTTSTTEQDSSTTSGLLPVSTTTEPDETTTTTTTEFRSTTTTEFRSATTADEVDEPTTTADIAPATSRDLLVPGDGSEGAQSTTTSSTTVVNVGSQEGVDEQTLVWLIVGGLVVVAGMIAAWTVRYWLRTAPAASEDEDVPDLTTVFRNT